MKKIKDILAFVFFFFAGITIILLKKYYSLMEKLGKPKKEDED